MGKAFNIGRNIMSAYGAVCLVSGIILTVAANADEFKKKPADENIVKKNGKTYFSVQNKEHDGTQPMGFHIG